SIESRLPPGLSIIRHLLCYRELAVVHYSGVSCSTNLQHDRQSLNLGCAGRPVRGKGCKSLQ
ncbi:MAG: hypothetical protein OQK67_06885, partial [Chlorobium sp.]|nr:hypothetical protein [Chlorobium sp.]